MQSPWHLLINYTGSFFITFESFRQLSILCFIFQLHQPNQVKVHLHLLSPLPLLSLVCALLHALRSARQPVWKTAVTRLYLLALPQTPAPPLCQCLFQCQHPALRYVPLQIFRPVARLPLHLRLHLPLLLPLVPRLFYADRPAWMDAALNAHLNAVSTTKEETSTKEAEDTRPIGATEDLFLIRLYIDFKKWQSFGC